MTVPKPSNARRRMAKLLSSDAAQYRIAKLVPDESDFCADVMEAFTQSAEVAALEETEALAVCEMAAKLQLPFGVGKDVTLGARDGRAVLMIGFQTLYALSKHLNAQEKQRNIV